jgi:GTP cyclohydrolase IA
MDKEKIKTAVRMILEAIGEDPDREGLIDTPRRVADMYEEVFAGLINKPEDELSVFFTEEHDEMILVKDIAVYSMCEHHLLPFFGTAHIAYIPRNGKVTGLSKLARVIDMEARKPQLQERLTTNIAEILTEKLNAQGVLVVIEAEHMCMTMRGIKKPGAKTLTSAVRGIFKTNSSTRQEAFALIRQK